MSVSGAPRPGTTVEMIYWASLSTKNWREMSVFWFRPNINIDYGVLMSFLLLEAVNLAVYIYCQAPGPGPIEIFFYAATGQAHYLMRVYKTVGWRHENNKPCVYLSVNFTILQMFSVIKLPSLWLTLWHWNIYSILGRKTLIKVQMEHKRMVFFKKAFILGPHMFWKIHKRMLYGLLLW